MTTLTAAVQAVPPRFEALRRFARAFAGSKSGMAGLAVLIAVTVLALAAPLLIHQSDLNVVGATGSSLPPPSAHYPLGTGQPLRSPLTLPLLGTLPSLPLPHT